MSMSRLLLLVLILFAGGNAICCAEDEPSANNPGIVQQKPSSGRFVKIDDGFMVPYRQPIPGTKQAIPMEPIPGIPANQSPTGKAIAPFWMARFETRHGDYLPYMQLYRTFQNFEQEKIRRVTPQNKIDAVTAPTEIYDPDISFEYGMNLKHPVGTMTLFCARQYTKWLSKLTEHEFRLPTANEWEHACRAGTKTKWHCGDDPQQLADFACFGDEQKVPGYQVVGQRKPNAWGLYDMHGNLAEWVLQPGMTDVNRQILKGGCWAFSAERCRSDSVLKFDDETFRNFDPMLPQSPWWLASDEALWVGFRIMRPLKPMSKSERKFAWECHTPEEERAVADHLEMGRGVLGLVDPQLPATIFRMKAQEARGRR